METIEVLAAETGVVTSIEGDDRRVVTLEHAELGGTESIYDDLVEVLVEVGQVVSKDEVVGSAPADSADSALEQRPRVG